MSKYTLALAVINLIVFAFTQDDHFGISANIFTAATFVILATKEAK